MKSLLSVLLAFVVLVACPVDLAAGTYKPTKIVLPMKPPKNRPGSPPRVFLDCSIEGSELIITLPYNSSMASVTFTSISGEVELEQYVTVDFPSVDITGLSGEYTLTVTTDTGKVFEGVIEL